MARALEIPGAILLTSWLREMWILSTIRDKRLIRSRSSWSREQVLAYQKSAFRDILRWVWDNSPFYHDYYSDHGISAGDFGDVSVSDPRDR